MSRFLLLIAALSPAIWAGSIQPVTTPSKASQAEVAAARILNPLNQTDLTWKTQVDLDYRQIATQAISVVERVAYPAADAKLVNGNWSAVVSGHEGRLAARPRKTR